MKTEEYRLKIADLERGRLPMSRLAEYLTDLASLLGYRDSVHFSHIEDGSTQIVATIDYQDVPKVKERLRSARQDDGSEEVDRAFYRLNRRLRTDNTSADLVTGDHTVIEFPGNKVRLDLEFGPFNEQASLIGVPIRIGGKNDPVPVHLRDMDGTIYECLARVATAQRIAKHMFEAPIQADGIGRWRREASGEWIMEKFTIKDFTVVRKDALIEAVQRLRKIKSPWSDSDDPIRELQEIRKG
jgi:hypothetical protein